MDAWDTYNNVVYQDTIWKPEQVSIMGGGGLRLTGSDVLVDGLYPGGLAYSKSFYQYGYFESRFKIPFGFLWLAYFLYDIRRNDLDIPKNEIDMFEWFGNNHIYVSTHIVKPNHWTIDCPVYDLSTAYHKFGVYWYPDLIKVYLDENLIATITDPAHIPQVPMNIMFQMSLGGQAAAPLNVTFPANMDVDYVKVWQKIT